MKSDRQNDLNKRSNVMHIPIVEPEEEHFSPVGKTESTEKDHLIPVLDPKSGNGTPRDGVENPFGKSEEPGEECRRLRQELMELRKININLRVQNGTLRQKNDTLAKENSSLKNERNQLRRQYDEVISDIDAPKSVAVEVQRDLKACVEGDVLLMEQKLTECLDSCKTELARYRDELEKMMYDTRMDIYRGDFGVLVNEYQKLYDYVTNRLPSIYKEGRLDREPLCDRLKRYINGIATGLLQTGLTAIFPMPGDSYDPNEHDAANGVYVDDDRDYQIVAVKYPGFKKENTVICRAAVMLNLNDTNENPPEIGNPINFTEV